MKVIVVSGACSNVGKTHLTRALCRLLPGAVRIKIGHHAVKSGGDDNFYQIGSGFSTIAAEHGRARFLITESNRILDKITPDCTICLPAENPKPSAEIAIKKANIIRGEPVPASTISLLAKRMECDEKVIRAIIELSGRCEPPLIGESCPTGRMFIERLGRSAKHGRRLSESIRPDCNGKEGVRK